MTPPEAAPMREDVTQADREAAADLASQFQRYTYVQVEAPAIRRGEHDDWELVIAFARHRLAHTARPDAGDEVERVAALTPWPGSHLYEMENSPAVMREGADPGMVEPVAWRWEGRNGSGHWVRQITGYCPDQNDPDYCRKVEPLYLSAALSRKGG